MACVLILVTPQIIDGSQMSNCHDKFYGDEELRQLLSYPSLMHAHGLV